MATPPGAEHRDLEQRFRDGEKKTRQLARTVARSTAILNGYRRISVAFTVTTDDNVVSVDQNVNGVLPDPTTCVGQAFTVKKATAATGSIVLTVTGGATIDGASSYSLSGTLRPSVTVVAAPTGYEVI